MKKKNLYLAVFAILFPVLSFCQKKSGQFHSIDTLNVVEGIYWVADSNSHFYNDTLITMFVSENFFDFSWNLLVKKETEFLRNEEMTKYIFYFKNGRIREIYSICDLKRKVGFYLLCHENGNIKTVGRYKTKISQDKAVGVFEMIPIEYWDTPTLYGDILGVYYIKEEKVGKWQYFDEYGYLIKEENYPDE